MAEGFQIMQATVQDKARVDKFMENVFIHDEPLSVFLKLAEDRHRSEEDDEDMEVLSQGLSLLALDEKGDMVGMALSGEMTPEGADFMEKKAILDQEKGFLKIMRFLSNMERRSGVWDKLGVTRGLGVFVLAVAPQVRGRGLGQSLLERSREIARQRQFPMMRVDCTSFFSAKICEKIGMQCIFSCSYSDYKDREDNPVFNPSAPHAVFRMFVQKL